MEDRKGRAREESLRIILGSQTTKRFMDRQPYHHRSNITIEPFLPTARDITKPVSFHANMENQFYQMIGFKKNQLTYYSKNGFLSVYTVL
jgi:hypothetical protein